jgi:hypothetical protein
VLEEPEELKKRGFFGLLVHFVRREENSSMIQ